MSDGTRISVSEVAALAGERPTTVSNWRSRYDDFPAGERLGREVLFDRSEILRWLELHRPNAVGIGAGAEGQMVSDLASSPEAADAALSLVCLSVLAPDRLAAALEIGTDPASVVSALSLEVERDFHAPDLLEPLRGVGGTEVIGGGIRLLLGSDGQLQPRAVLVEMFDRLLSRRSSSRSRWTGESRTPEWLGELMVELVTPERGFDSGDVVFDPAVGEGGLLIGAARHAGVDLNLHGWEIAPDLVRLARQRLLVQGISRARVEIEQVDSLGEAHESLGARAVVSDPPMGLKVDPGRWRGSDPRWAKYGVTGTNADLAWVALALYHLTEGARAAVLTSRGALHRPGLEAHVRGRLLDAGAIEAIIGLPAGTALYTSMPLVLWLLRTPSPTPHPGDVLFIDAGVEDSHSTTTRPGRGLPPSASGPLSEEIRRTVTAWRSSPRDAALRRGFARAHPTKLLLSGDVQLDPVRLVQLPAGRDQLVSEAITASAELADLMREQRSLPAPRVSAHAFTNARSVKLGRLIEEKMVSLISGQRIKTAPGGTGTPVIGPWSFGDEQLRFSLNAHAQLESDDVIIMPRAGGFQAFVNINDAAALEAPLQALRLHRELIADGLDPALLAELINVLTAPLGTAGRHSVKNLEIPMLPAPDAAEIRELLLGLRRQDALSSELQRARGRLRSLVLEALSR